MNTSLLITIASLYDAMPLVLVAGCVITALQAFAAIHWGKGPNMLTGILCAFSLALMPTLIGSSAYILKQPATPQLIREVKSMPGTQVEALRAAIDKGAPLSVHKVLYYTDIPSHNYASEIKKKNGKETPESNAQKQAIN